MSAFAAALDVLFADRNLARPATWQGGDGETASVRVMRRQPDEVTGFGGARVWSETSRIDVRVSEVPSPRPGDRVVIEGEVFEVQGEPLRDRERLVWTVDLRSET